MSWYNSSYLYRKALSINNDAASTTLSIDFTLPSDIDDFWDNVQADGDDIFITEGDGFTPIDNSNATAIVIDDGAGGAFSGSTKAGRIRIDQWTNATATAQNYVWVYYGNSAATSNSAFGTWSSPTTKTARISRLSTQRLPRKDVIQTAPEASGATTPALSFGKTSTGTRHLYWDFTRELAERDVEYEGYLWYEGIVSATLAAETGGTPTSAVVTTSDIRMLGKRGSVLRTIHPAGTDATSYTIKLAVTTTTGRVLDRRCVLAVNDPDET